MRQCHRSNVDELKCLYYGVGVDNFLYLLCQERVEMTFIVYSQERQHVVTCYSITCVIHCYANEIIVETTKATLTESFSCKFTLLH